MVAGPASGRSVFFPSGFYVIISFVFLEVDMKKGNLWQDFEPKKLFPAAMLGLVAGAIDLPLLISFGVLIFSGGLASFSTFGIGMMLFGAVIMQVIIASISSVRGMMGGPQDSPAAIMALAGVAISASMAGASDEARFATVLATIIITTVGSGLLFIVIGGFNLSRFVRFIPYPVVGGFIAGTGLLLSQGSLSVMLDSPVSITNLGMLFTIDALMRWIPGTIFGIVLLLASRRSQHILVTPALLTIATLAFYGVLWFSGVGLIEARTLGWLLGPFPAGALWKPIDFSLISQVNWMVIGNQTSNIGAAMMISVVALLLNASALELIGKEDIDLNRELITTGIANLAGGLSGSSTGYHYLGLSALPMRAGIKSRLIGFFSAAMLGSVLLFGATLLSLIPKFIVGGLLLFVGLSFLAEWVYDAIRHLPRMDYLLVLVILIIVATLGFLQGIGAGIVIAVILFVINYSRLEFVKDTLSGANYRSNMERPIEHRRVLEEKAGQIHILRLQGFLFFGTAQSLLNRIRERLRDPQMARLRYLILDFHRVSALDSSAVLSFTRLYQLAETNRIHLVVTELKPAIQKRLEQGGLIEGEDTHYKVFSSLDYGMEWCEKQILAEDSRSLIMRAASLQAQLKKVFSTPEQIERFMKYLERQEFDKGHALIKQGDPPESMYFVDAGRVSAQLAVEDGHFVRLRSMGGGTVVGEIGLYLEPDPHRDNCHRHAQRCVLS